MPCCCETNLKAAFVIGIIDLVLSCIYFAFGATGYLIIGSLIFFIIGGISIVVSIVLIVGAKAPNASALLVWMILACLKCAFSIGYTIYVFVNAVAFVHAYGSAYRLIHLLFTEIFLYYGAQKFLY